MDGRQRKVQVAVTVETPEEGIELVHIRLKSEQPEIPPVFRLSWKQARRLSSAYLMVLAEAE